jgi:hypothetical protein
MKLIIQKKHDVAPPLFPRQRGRQRLPRAVCAYPGCQNICRQTINKYCSRSHGQLAHSLNAARGTPPEPVNLITVAETPTLLP